MNSIYLSHTRISWYIIIILYLDKHEEKKNELNKIMCQLAKENNFVFILFFDVY